METFSERLARLMKSRNINQKTLSTLASIAQGTISKYRNGQEPKSAELYRMAKALGVSMDYLYSGQNIEDAQDGIHADKSAVAISGNATNTVSSIDCRDCQTVARLTAVIEALSKGQKK